MNLTQMQTERIANFVPVFRQYLDSGGGEADLADRQARSELYAQLLSPIGLEQITKKEIEPVDLDVA